MVKVIKRYDDFSFGVVDKKFLARSGLNLRDHGLESASNVWVSNSGSLVSRPGTKLIKDFGENAMIKCFTFARGQNQQYLLVFSQGRQQIFYLDQKGFLVEASEDDVEQQLVPDNLASNTDQGYNIVSTAAHTNAYTIFGNEGLSDSDVYTIDITFPNPITFFRVVMEIGACAVLQGTFYKSTGESWVASANTEATTYPRTSCVASGCRTTYTNGYVNKTQHTFEFPTGVYAYNDIKRIVLTARRYTSYTTGNFPQNYTTGYQLTNGILKKLSIFGTTTTGEGAVWHKDIPVDKIEQASYDFTNRYLFFAQRDISPYVVSVFGAFTFAPLAPSFPTDYNFQTMGYPDVVCCGQSRLWLAGFERETTSILGSAVGYNLTDLQNFTPSTTNNVVLPSSAVKFQPTDIRNKINWAVAANALNFASWDGIFKMTYGNDQPISATGAVVLKQNEEASSRVFPAWFNGMMCFSSMGRDELRLMDYNLQRERQYSVNISKFSNDLNAKKIKKILFKKDNNGNMYVLYDDGTAALVKVVDEKVAGFFPFSVLDGIQDIMMGKGDNGERTYLVVNNNSHTQLLLMDEIDYPKMPAIDYTDLTESMENVSEWLYQKAVMDAKVYKENLIEFEPAFMVSQIQTENPTEVNNLIETYPQWVRLKNPPFGETDFSAYVGERLFFEDTATNANFAVDIYSVPRTDGTTGVYYAWVPVEDAFNMIDVLYTTSTTNLSHATTYLNLNGVFYSNTTAAVATTSGTDTITVNSMAGVSTGQGGSEYKRAPAKDVDQGAFIFGVPVDSNATYWQNEIENDGTTVWALSAWQGYVGISVINLDYSANQFAVFSNERYIGSYCGSAVCGNELDTITLDEPVPKVVYGVPYDMNFKIGYVMNSAAYARRLISTLSINTANSWGLKIGTNSNEDFQDMYYAMLLGLPFKDTDIKTLVDMYQADTNVYGLNPVPMKPFIQLTIPDDWSEYKAIVVQQTIPYPFEIFSIEATLEENNSERGQ